MKYDVIEGNVKRDLEWLKSPNNGLHDYKDVVKHLLNEVGALKQSSIDSKRDIILAFLDWHYEDDVADKKTKETIVDTYLSRS